MEERLMSQQMRGWDFKSNPPKAKPAGPTQTKDCLIIQAVCGDEAVSVVGACRQICKFLIKIK